MTAAPTQRVLTTSPTVVLRRSVFWIAATVFALVVAIVGILLSGSFSPSDPLDSQNPAPGGAKALAEVLRQQGVDVTATATLDETRDAVDDAAATTLFFYDPSGYLDTGQRTEAFGLAERVVVVDPDFSTLLDLSPDIAQAGQVEGTVAADCALPAADNAGSITVDGFGYRYTGAGDAVECFDSGDGVHSVVQIETATGRATVVGATAALSNESIGSVGNAAFALTLLGESPDLVWYIPTAADLVSETTPTLGELSPAWVIPLTSLLLLTAIAAGIWRGRRFGPLVIENLPVTVRANETMQGRARLYERSSARLRALDSLRIGAVERIGRLCGLPRAATVDEVIAAASALTGLRQTDVRRTLLDAVPASDRDLVRLSDDLLTLERAVAASVTPT
ncbi:hypothetical protein HD599_002515 [Conyzicola lurida]|uniref:DUF4350 domain-containing protein n=1 Tax=Conyzicola lurida TaxID=1172621 RepID=A0A841AQG7_9MICO|nr:DUF4350 domain-containing protein [Conyzicola lurida]MBB5844192.1 hypothetical protein [Conyzicola lurida]